MAKKKAEKMYKETYKEQKLKSQDRLDNLKKLV